MSILRLSLVVAGLAIVGVICARPAAAQPSGAPAIAPAAAPAADPNQSGGGADPNKPPAVVRFDPNQILRMMASLPRDANVDRYWLDPNQLTLKDSLGATDEDWSALLPKIKKIQKLQAQSYVRWPTAPSPDAMAPSPMQSPAMVSASGVPPVVAEPSELEQAAAGLSRVLADKGATGGDVKSALQTFLQARAKLKADLEKAQKDLQELLTVRQEAILKQKGLFN